jgi:hypothetical protein
VDLACVTLSRYSWPIAITLRKPYLNAHTLILEHFTKLTNLTGLDLRDAKLPNPENYILQFTRLTRLKHIRVPGNNESILGHYPNLTELTLGGPYRYDLDAHRLSYFSNLNSLIATPATLQYGYWFLCLPNPSRLTSLSFNLWIQDKNLSGRLDCGNATRLVNLKRLEYECDNGEAESFPLMTSLESLAASSLVDLASFPNLTYLALNDVGTQPLYWTALGALTKLQQLKLETCTIDDDRKMTFLTLLTDLSELHLGTDKEDNRFSEVFDFVQSTKLSSLEVILSQPNLLVHEALNSIARNLTALKHIKLLVSGRILTDFYDLRMLAANLTDLQNMTIELARWEPQVLTNLSLLTSLRINKVSALSIPILPNLESLFVSRMPPSDWEAVARCTRLTYLEEGILYPSVVAYSRISHLPLQYLKVAGEGFDALTRLTDLHTLYVTSAFDHENVAYLSVLPKLTKLVSYKTVTHWQSLTMLSTLLDLEMVVSGSSAECEQLFATRLVNMKIRGI